jgi:SNF2 family DNA or RNA helicase
VSVPVIVPFFYSSDSRIVCPANIIESTWLKQIAETSGQNKERTLLVLQYQGRDRHKLCEPAPSILYHEKTMSIWFKAFQRLKAFDIVITSYETLMNEHKNFIK